MIRMYSMMKHNDSQIIPYFLKIQYETAQTCVYHSERCILLCRHEIYFGNRKWKLAVIWSLLLELIQRLLPHWHGPISIIFRLQLAIYLSILTLYENCPSLSRTDDCAGQGVGGRGRSLEGELRRGGSVNSPHSDSGEIPHPPPPQTSSSSRSPSRHPHPLPL